MFARFVLGTITAGAMIMPALAGMMTAEEARRFVAGKVFAFTCFDGTRGAGRILDDMGISGAVQFSGSGPIRRVRLPGNTLQIRGQAVCASLRGLPFEPCFNLEKKDERSFRGSVSGMSFAYCDFHHQGAAQMLMARAVARPRPSTLVFVDLVLLALTIVVLAPEGGWWFVPAVVAQTLLDRRAAARSADGPASGRAEA